ncbi:MAG: hypothetical protein RLZZ339_2484 [Cyanobacteriota bacterium]|jgi:hypothetical protein
MITITDSVIQRIIRKFILLRIIKMRLPCENSLTIAPI